MGYTIAVAGKGGVGKTTIASLIVRYLQDSKKGTILAVDADPNSNLGQLLGVESNTDLGRIVDDIAKNPSQVPTSISKTDFIEYKIETLISEADGFDLLTMGRPEGPGCYCAANNTLRTLLGKLTKSYDYVVIDNEAGMEHLSRKTTRRADIFILVSDATTAGIKAAKRIYELSLELALEIKNMYVIINRLDKDVSINNFKTDFSMPKINDVFSLQRDDSLYNLSLNEGVIFDLDKSSKALNGFRKIMEGICP